jgi:phasin family protein
VHRSNVPAEEDVTKVSDPATKSAKPAVKAPRAAAAKTKPAETVPAPVVTAPVAVETPVEEQPAAQAVETAVPVTEIPETPVAAAVEAPAIVKETIMADVNFKEAADKGQAYFAEFNTRAKAAFEKASKGVEEMNEFGKGNVEAFVESGKIAAKGLETLGQGYAEFGRKSFEGATAALKNLAAVKTPAEFLQLHSDYVRGQFDALVAETSKNTEAFIKLAGDVAQPISNRIAVAAEKAKVAA